MDSGTFLVDSYERSEIFGVIANQSADWCGNLLDERTNLKNQGIPTPVCALARNDTIFSSAERGRAPALRKMCVIDGLRMPPKWAENGGKRIGSGVQNPVFAFLADFGYSVYREGRIFGSYTFTSKKFWILITIFWKQNGRFMRFLPQHVVVAEKLAKNPPMGDGKTGPKVVNSPIDNPSMN